MVERFNLAQTPGAFAANPDVTRLLEEKGDITSALAQLKEIQKGNPDNDALKQKISQLEAGQRSIPPASVIDSAPLQ